MAMSCFKLWMVVKYMHPVNSKLKHDSNIKNNNGIFLIIARYLENHLQHNHSLWKPQYTGWFLWRNIIRLSMLIKNYAMYVRTVPLTNCLHSIQCLIDGAQSVQVHRCPQGRKTTDTGLNEHLRQNRSLLCCCTMSVNVTGTSEIRVAILILKLKSYI